MCVLLVNVDNCGVGQVDLRHRDWLLSSIKLVFLRLPISRAREAKSAGVGRQPVVIGGFGDRMTIYGATCFSNARLMLRRLSAADAWGARCSQACSPIARSAGFARTAISRGPTAARSRRSSPASRRDRGG